LIEDSLEFAEVCVESGIPVLLMDAAWNQKPLLDGIVRVHSWEEVMKNIEEMGRKD
jgi:uncharacterized HAD superfamily protein